MRTKTVELSVNQVKVHYDLDAKGIALMGGVKVELVNCDIDPALVTRVKFPTLDLDNNDVSQELKVKVTYLDLTDKDKKYASKIKNWISKS